jgi:hypothetical protein
MGQSAAVAEGPVRMYDWLQVNSMDSQCPELDGDFVARFRIVVPLFKGHRKCP